MKLQQIANFATTTDAKFFAAAIESRVTAGMGALALDTAPAARPAPQPAYAAA